MARIATSPEAQAPALGEAPAFRDMLAHVSRLAPLDRPVLVVGERGTGKELVAGRLAYLSRRWDRPFIKLNCAALTDSLLDSELFGHEAGAFTGAIRRRPGRFELADGGTLFLDEIATASLSVQEKLLRVIEYGAFDRVGGSDTLHVDVRIIAATNADLRKRAQEGSFRPDLLDRLAFDVVCVPALRDRPEDIPLLATHFARRMAGELGHSVFAGFTQPAQSALTTHAWPGNVRELRNVVERSLCRMEHPDQMLDHLVIDPFPGAPQPTPQPTPTPAPLVDFTAQLAAFATSLLQQALADTRFNQRAAAARLGLTYYQFRHQLKLHGLHGAKPAA